MRTAAYLIPEFLPPEGVTRSERIAAVRRKRAAKQAARSKVISLRKQADYILGQSLTGQGISLLSDEGQERMKTASALMAQAVETERGAGLR